METDGMDIDERLRRQLKLIRVAQSPHGTQGVLRGADNVCFALCLERQWDNNKQDVSRIPAGDYICRRVQSPKFGETFEICEVIGGRTLIRFHWGTFLEHTLGCVLVGEEFGVHEGRPALLSSRRGFAEFLRRYEGVDEFPLSIVEALG
jgi:hypothetical protein